MDILEYIKQMQEIYGDKVITTADKLEKPPKTVVREMFQNAFTDNKAYGGRAGYNDGQLVTPLVDGSRPGYSGRKKTAVKFDKFRVKIPTGEFIGEGRDKSEIFKIKNTKSGSVRYTVVGAGGGKRKFYNSIEEVKKAKLDFLPDELVKIDSKLIKEGIKEVTYKNKKTNKIVKYYKPRVGDA